MKDIRIPQDYEEYSEDVMSNFDHEIDEVVAKHIKNKKLFASYPGWNFYGKVWYKHKQWNCEVWTYKSYNTTFIADTLREIMDNVSWEYGHE